MSGSRINEAKDTLLLFLKSLPMGCYFNIIGFGSNFEVLFRNGSCEYSKESLKEACEHQKQLSADMGGTEILLPFKHIYNTPPMETHTRQILLLTDGEVSNTEEVIEIVKKNASNTRVFALGIGDGASTALINGVARVGQGRAEFVKSGQKMQPLVMKIVKAMMQPDVSELKLDWKLDGSPKFVQVPRKLPPMFAGDRFISYAIFPKSIALHGKVHLTGKIGERSLNFELSVDDGDHIPASDDSLPIHRLAAKAEIKQQQDDDPKGNKSAIVLLSTAANIISCHTSMVGVDKGRKELVKGKMTKRRVPLMMSRAVPSPAGGMRPKSAKSGSVSSFFQGLRLSRFGNDPTVCAAPKSSSFSAFRNKRRSYSSTTGSSVSSAFDKKINPFRRLSSLQSDYLNSRSRLPDLDCSEESMQGSYSAEFSIPKPQVNCWRPSAELLCRAPDSYLSDPDVFCGGKDESPRGSIPAVVSTYTITPSLRSADDSNEYTRRVPILPPALAPPPAIEPQKRSKTDMMALISLQTFLGSWELTQELAEELLLDLTEMKSSSPIKVEDVWGTLLALACLHVQFAGERDEWEMIELKAKQWLMQKDMEGSNFDELLRKAKQFISGN